MKKLNESNVIILSVIIFILGTCVGIVTALLSTIISKRFEHIKGKVLGVFNFVRYIGMTVGALLIGIISQPLVAFYFTTITIYETPTDVEDFWLGQIMTMDNTITVSYTHLTLPTNREV
ncbi:hypothetical protein JMUB7536_27510 [Staphylococcus aureus]